MQGNKCISFVFLSDKQLIWKITFFSWTRQILHLFYFPKHVVLNWKQLYLSVVTDVFHWVIWPLTASNLYMHYIFLRTLYYCSFIAENSMCPGSSFICSIHSDETSGHYTSVSFVLDEDILQIYCVWLCSLFK